MKIVKESLFEVLRSDDEWANQQIARNVDRYKSEIKEKPIETDIDNEAKQKDLEAFVEFMLTTEPPLFVKINFNETIEKYRISLDKKDKDYEVIIIEHEYGDNELEYEYFQILEDAFLAIIQIGQYKNVKEIVDSAGKPLFIK